MIADPAKSIRRAMMLARSVGDDVARQVNAVPPHPASLIPGIHVKAYPSAQDRVGLAEGGKPDPTAPEPADETGFDAYHGSPHDFDKFDVSKIGTGEGAQAYGHGLYFAQNEDVAKIYRDALSPSDALVGGKPYNAKDPEHFAAMSRSEYPDDATAIRNLQSGIAQYKKIKASWVPAAIAQHEDVISRIQRGGLPPVQEIPHGHLYHVRIKANPEHFLDWDKPLSEQHPAIRKAIASNYDPVSVVPLGNGMSDLKVGKGTIGTFKDAEIGDPVQKAMSHDPRTGEMIYRALGERPIQKPVAFKHPMTGQEGVTNQVISGKSASAERLKQSGIPGVRYLDAGSRGHGDGSRNYVVFDHNLVDIKRKYAHGGSVRQSFAKGGSVVDKALKIVSKAKPRKHFAVGGYDNTLDQVLGTNNPTMQQIFGASYPKPPAVSGPTPFKKPDPTPVPTPTPKQTPGLQSAAPLPVDRGFGPTPMPMGLSNPGFSGAVQTGNVTPSPSPTPAPAPTPTPMPVSSPAITGALSFNNPPSTISSSPAAGAIASDAAPVGGMMSGPTPGQGVGSPSPANPVSRPASTPAPFAGYPADAITGLNNQQNAQTMVNNLAATPDPNNPDAAFGAATASQAAPSPSPSPIGGNPAMGFTPAPSLSGNPSMLGFTPAPSISFSAPSADTAAASNMSVPSLTGVPSPTSMAPSTDPGVAAAAGIPTAGIASMGQPQGAVDPSIAAQSGMTDKSTMQATSAPVDFSPASGPDTSAPGDSSAVGQGGIGSDTGAADAAAASTGTGTGDDGSTGPGPGEKSGGMIRKRKGHLEKALSIASRYQSGGAINSALFAARR